jgi:small GTP-binding protein
VQTQESLENRAIEILTDRNAFDLTDHEAKCYLTLLKQGVMAASEISEATNITHQRIYPVVSSLESKGMVIPDGASRPQLFRALSPRKALRQRINILQIEWEERAGNLEILLKEFVEIAKKGLQPKPQLVSAGVPTFHTEELAPPLTAITKLLGNAQSHIILAVGDFKTYEEHFHADVASIIHDGITCEVISQIPFPPDLLADLTTSSKQSNLPENSVTFVIDDQVWILCSSLPGSRKYRFVLSTVPEQVAMNKHQLLATARSEEETVWSALDVEEKEFQEILADGIPPNFQLKIIVAGQYNVGKTSLKNVYLGKGFQTQYVPTAGLEMTQDPSNQVHGLRTSIWDVAGQPSFEQVRRDYYRNSHGAMLVFDVSDYNSFEILDKWIRTLWNHTTWGAIPIVIVGNKVDLRSETESGMIMDEAAKTFAAALNHEAQTKDYGFGVSYIATSAKTGMNTSAAFRLLTLRALRWARDKGHLARS